MYNFFGYFLSSTLIVLSVLIIWFVIQFKNESKYLKTLKLKNNKEE